MMQLHHSTPIWMPQLLYAGDLMSYNLRPGSFQIREIITNKEKQADDLFHGELIFITE